MFDFIKENVFSIWFLIFLVYVVLRETFQRLYSNTLNKIRVVNGKYNADYEIELKILNNEETFDEYKDFQTNSIVKNIKKLNLFYNFMFCYLPILFVIKFIVLFIIGKTDKIDTINNIIILVIELFLFKVLFFKEEKNKLNEMKLKYGLTKLNKEKLFKKKKFLDNLIKEDKSLIVCGIIFLVVTIFSFLKKGIIEINSEFIIFEILVAVFLVALLSFKRISYNFYKMLPLRNINVIMFSDYLKRFYFPSKYKKEFQEVLAWFYDNDKEFMSKFMKGNSTLEETYFKLLENKEFQEKVIEKILDKTNI
jgi:membrane protein